MSVARVVGARRRQLVKPLLPITTASQLPSLPPELPIKLRRADLATGLGAIVFDGRQGPGFMKGGHNDTTGHTWVWMQRRKRCVVTSTTCAPNARSRI